MTKGHPMLTDMFGWHVTAETQNAIVAAGGGLRTAEHLCDAALGDFLPGFPDA